jgi:hypothetical protein
MHFGNDGKGQRYVEWEIHPSIYKRAWIQHRTGQKDWAGTGRYLNVVRVESVNSGPKGQAADFPVYLSSSQMGDDQILTTFVYSVCAAVGNNHP